MTQYFILEAFLKLSIVMHCIFHNLGHFTEVKERKKRNHGSESEF